MFLFAVCFVLFCFCCAQLGLDPKDLTRRGTTVHGYFEHAYDNFNARVASMVSMRQDYADPVNQKSLSDTMALIRKHPQVTTRLHYTTLHYTTLEQLD